MIAHPDEEAAPASKRWVYRFLQRNPEVKMKPSTSLEATHPKETTPEAIRRFYADLGDAVYSLSVGSDRVYNMDEHGLYEGLTKSGKVIGDSITRRSIITESDNRNWVSTLESGNAQGRRLRLTVAFGGNWLQEQWFYKDFPSWGYDVSETGWANQRVCEKWPRETFLPETKPSDITLWRILLVDGFYGHIPPRFRFMALFYRVQVIYLPPHSLHSTQPLDVCVFGPI
jgi:4-hydroxybenzoate polyprenyltransferase